MQVVLDANSAVTMLLSVMRVLTAPAIRALLTGILLLCVSW